MLSLLGLIGDNEKNSSTEDDNKVLSHSEIDEICSRLGLKTSLEEKRKCLMNIISALKLSKVEVSCICMDSVLHTLRSYRTDKEIVKYCFDILISIMRPNHSKDQSNRRDSDLSSQFAEIFLKSYENVQLTVDFLQTHMKDIKGQAVNILSILAEHHPQRLQSVILEVTLGIPKLTDLLCEQNDIIRSQILFILSNVICGSSDIRKMLVFENIFEKLMKIIIEENGLDGSQIVVDALLIIKILVNEDQSVQNHFRQSGLYYKLWTLIISNKDFYSLPNLKKESNDRLHPSTDVSVKSESQPKPFIWSDCSVSIFKGVLEIFQSFTSVNFSISTVVSFQQEMRTSGIIDQVTDWVIKVGTFPKSLRIEIVYTLAGFVRGNKENCQHLFVSSKYNDSVSFLHSKFLTMMMDSRSSISYRLAIFHLIQSMTIECENPYIDNLKQKLRSVDEALTDFQIFDSLLDLKSEGISVWLCYSVLSSMVMNYPEVGDLLVGWQRSDDMTAVSKSIGSHNSHPISSDNGIFPKRNVLFYYYINFPFSVENSECARAGMLCFFIIWLNYSQSAFDHFTEDCRCQSQLIGDMFTDSRMTSIVTMSLNALLYGIILLKCTKPAIREVFLKSLKQKSNVKDLCAKISLLGKSEQFMLFNISPRVAFSKYSTPLLSSLFCEFYRENECEVVKKLMDINNVTVRVSEVDVLKEKITELEKNILSLRNSLNQLQTENTSLVETNQKIKEENEFLLLMIADQDTRLKSSQTAQQQATIVPSHEKPLPQSQICYYPYSYNEPVIAEAAMINQSGCTNTVQPPFIHQPDIFQYNPLPWQPHKQYNPNPVYSHAENHDSLQFYPQSYEQNMTTYTNSQNDDHNSVPQQQQQQTFGSNNYQTIPYFAPNDMGGQQKYSESPYPIHPQSYQSESRPSQSTYFPTP